MKDLDSIKLNDYEMWVNANSTKKFSLFDYMHGVMLTENLSSDLFIAFLKLVWPEFYSYNNCVFLKEQFDQKKYDELVDQGLSNKDIEYWINLVLIDGIFENATVETCEYLAKNLVSAWKVKLKNDFPEKDFELKYFFEEEDGFFVVFSQNDI